jgi:hypothetical protein
MIETTPATMTPEQARAACDAGLHMMGITRWLLTKAVADLWPQQWLHQVAPGANHPMFNFGHLVVCDGNFLLAAGGAASPVPESYGPLFDGGAAPRTDASAYPAPVELLQIAEQARTDLVAHLKALSGEQLLGPIAEPRLKDLIPCLAHLPNFISMHEGTHAGQILIVRKALGLPRVLGGGA